MKQFAPAGTIDKRFLPAKRRNREHLAGRASSASLNIRLDSKTVVTATSRRRFAPLFQRSGSNSVEISDFKSLRRRVGDYSDHELKHVLPVTLDSGFAVWAVTTRSIPRPRNSPAVQCSTYDETRVSVLHVSAAFFVIASRRVLAGRVSLVGTVSVSSYL